MLQMQESGEITALKIKWWKEKRGGGACDDAGEDSGAEELDVANVGGCFVVLICGSIFAIFISILEMLLDIYQRSRELEVPFVEELINEMKFFIKCQGNTKTVRRKKSKVREDSVESSSSSTVTYSTQGLKKLRKLDSSSNESGTVQSDDDERF